MSSVVFVHAGRAFLCLCLCFTSLFLASCETYEDPAHSVMKDYYAESQGLSQASTDSVSRFTMKVNEFTTRIPAAKKDALYTRIQENIKLATLRITLDFDADWDSEVHIDF